MTFKLKTRNFRLPTRARKRATPTQLAEVLYQTCLPPLSAEADGRAFRLIGVGGSSFSDPERADVPNLLDGKIRIYARVEGAIEAVRRKFGRPAISKGRSFLER